MVSTWGLRLVFSPSYSFCILLTFPNSLTVHLIAPKTGPMGPKNGHNRLDYPSMAAPTHPKEPSDFQ